MGWTRFVIVRMAVFAFASLGAAAVLGMASHQATLFLHNQYDRPYIIFAIVVSGVTLLACLGLSTRYTFRTHLPIIAVLAILWLALASYTTDRISYVQCESLDGQTRPSRSGDINGTYNAVSWCREMKAMMAFSWFDWALFMIAIVSWLRLSEHEENTYGSETHSMRHEDRAIEEAEHGNERLGGRRGMLEGGGYYPQQPMMTGGGQRYVSTGPQYAQQVPLQTGGQVVYQQPGHSVVLQNGQVTQVPGVVQGQRVF